MAANLKYPHAETAKGIAALGRNGDDAILHVSKTELAIMDAVTPGGLTTNPETGEKEAFFWLMPLISGLGTWAATGDFKKGLMSGLLGLATGGLGNMLGAGGGAAGAAGAAAAEAGKGAVSGGLAEILKGAGGAASAGAGAVGSAAQAAKGLAGAASGGIGAIGKGMGDLGHLGSTMANKVPLGDVLNIPAPKPGGGGGGILQQGIGLIRRHPMAASLLGSALLSGMGGQGDAPEGEEAPDIPRQMPVGREHIPFDSSQFDPSPSTSLPGEPGSYGPDDIYNYGQVSGERQMFNPAAGPVVVEPTEELAAGGRVKGPGTRTSDSVPAVNVQTGKPYALSNEEYILPAYMVDAIGGGNNSRGADRLDQAKSAMAKIREKRYSAR